ncbi:hypothetical protein ACFLTS_01530 [Chloroflexota bacterium]
MSVPAMNYVGCGFDWLFMLLCTGGYFYTLKKTGKRWNFWLIFAASWVVFGVSYLLIISGIPSREWYITMLRVIGYVLVTATIFSLIVKLSKPE